jgi:hypothetical protein
VLRSPARSSPSGRLLSPMAALTGLAVDGLPWAQTGARRRPKRRLQTTAGHESEQRTSRNASPGPRHGRSSKAEYHPLSLIVPRRGRQPASGSTSTAASVSLPIAKLAAQDFSDVGFGQRVDELNNLWRLVGGHLLAAMYDHILDCQRGIRSALARVLETQGRAMGLSDRSDIDFIGR